MLNGDAIYLQYLEPFNCVQKTAQARLENVILKICLQIIYIFNIYV